MNKCHAGAIFSTTWCNCTPVVLEEVVLVVVGRFPQKVWSFEACWCRYCYWCQLTLILQIRRHKKFNSVIHPTELDQQNMRKYIEICFNPKSEILSNVFFKFFTFLSESQITLLYIVQPDWSSVSLNGHKCLWWKKLLMVRGKIPLKPLMSAALLCVFLFVLTSQHQCQTENMYIGLSSVCPLCAFVIHDHIQIFLSSYHHL